MMLLMTEIKKISNLIKLNNKLSVVTGGTGHLGLAISETLAELGSDIILVGQDEVKGNDVVKRLSKEFEVKVEFYKVDLNLKSEIDTFLTKINSNVDILVNNAFTWPNVLKIEETSWNDFENTLTTGITSPFYLTKQMIERMRKNRSGNILNVGSMYGIVSPNFKIYHKESNMGNALAYNASKAAMIQMTKYLAVYCAEWNIRVNCISPGPFPRPGTFSNGKEWFKEELQNMNPMKKLGEPWHLKGVVALLSSDLGTYMTGQNISVDGGWTTW